MPAPAQLRTRRPSAAARSTKWLKSFISRSSKSSDENLQENFPDPGEINNIMEDGVEILVPSAIDVVYKYTWNVHKFGQSLRKKGATPNFDSEAFEVNVNGLRTRWNLSIRFWTGPDGTRLQSPVVACLNLLRCYTVDSVQATVRYQFGIFCNQSGRYEMSSSARSVLALGATKHIVSVGHQDVAVLQRHLDSAAGDIRLVCRLQVVPTESDEERHTLSQDFGSLLFDECAPSWARGDVLLKAIGTDTLIPAHRCILGARSPRFAELLELVPINEAMTPTLELDDVTPDVLQELLRYIYTGRAESLESLSPLLLAASAKYSLPGLATLSERSLIDTLNIETVPARLLLADEFGCDNLRKAALSICETHQIPKSAAWSLMEAVNPNLFQEACEAGIGGSASSFGSSSISDTASNSR